MKVGDDVDVGLTTGEKVGPGKIDVLSHAAATVKVTVERPRVGLYTFEAPRTWFKQVAPDRWKLDLPDTARDEFILPEEEA